MIRAVIYADGHSLEVSGTEAARLRELGLAEPHPGQGGDGISVADLRLAPDVSWEDVFAELGRET